MLIKRKPLTFVLLGLFLLALAAGRANAGAIQSENGGVTLTLSQFLSRAVKEQPVTFMVEGAAGELDLAAEVVLPTERLTLERLVTIVAAQADMKAERVGKTFLLTRRYHEQMPIPSISPLEMKQSLEDAAAIIRPFIPSRNDLQDYPAKKEMLHLFEMLTPKQVEMLKTGLSYSDMTPEQQQALTAFSAAYFYSTAYWETMGAHETLCTIFEKDAYFHLNPNRLGRVLLSAPVNRKYFPFPLEMTEEAMERNNDSKAKAEIVLARFTLAQISEMLNKRVGTVRYAADAGLRDKLTYLFGEAQLSVPQVAQMVAKLHSLRLRREGDVLSFARVPSFPIGGAAGVPSAVAKSWPASLRRLWYLSPEGVPLTPENASPPTVPSAGRIPVRLPRNPTANTEAILQAVKQLLFAGLEKRILESPDKKLRVASLTPEEQQMLCQWLVPKLLTHVYIAQQELPDYVAAPNRIVLKGSFDPVPEKEGSLVKHLTMIMQTAKPTGFSERQPLNSWFLMSFPVPGK